MVSVQSTDIPPKENVTYAKQTQTTASGVSELRDGKLYVNFVANIIARTLVFYTFWVDFHWFPFLLSFVSTEIMQTK